MNRESSGDIMRRLRKAKGVTIVEMADKIGLSDSAISAYERNQRSPRDDVKVRISQYLGRSVGYIFFSNNNHK